MSDKHLQISEFSSTTIQMYSGTQTRVGAFCFLLLQVYGCTEGLGRRSMIWGHDTILRCGIKKGPDWVREQGKEGKNPS